MDDYGDEETTSAPSGDAPEHAAAVLDEAALHRNFRGRADLIAEVLQDFVGAQDASVAELMRSLAERDPAVVRARAHRVKSAALTACAGPLARAAAAVEAAADAGDLDRAVALAVQVPVALERTRAAVDDAVARLRPERGVAP